MLTVKQAAVALGLSGRRVRALCERGQIPGARLESSPVLTYWLIPDPPIVTGKPRGRPRKIRAADSTPE